MKKFFMIAALAAFPVASYAQDASAGLSSHSFCEQLTDFAWKCPKPTRAEGPPKCYLFGDDQICDRPLSAVPQVTYTKPSNCGWNKAGKYACW
jgi:hypothetical protein